MSRCCFCFCFGLILGRKGFQNWDLGTLGLLWLFVCLSCDMIHEFDTPVVLFVLFLIEACLFCFII